MELTFVGHACFHVRAADGLRILLDPYLPGAFQGRMGLRAFLEPVDVVVSTHDHLDHGHVDPAFGDPVVVRASAEARGIAFSGLRLPHDAEEGARRGFVTGFRFEVDGVSLVHPGDLGRPFTADEVRALAPVDVLLLPVGGTFTVGPAEAVEAVRRLRPRAVVPMHYKVPAVDLAIGPLDPFLDLARAEGWPVVEPPGPAWAVDLDALPGTPAVVVLRPTH